MNRVMRNSSSMLLAIATALMLTLAGCGGGSSSAGGGGGGSGGTIAGTVDNGLAANHVIDRRGPALLAFAEVVIRSAHAAGVSGVTVELLDGMGMVVRTTTTGADGSFVFTGLAAGSYSIRLSQAGSVLGETASVQVDSNTRTNIKLSLGGEMTSIEVEVEAEDDHISGEVETEGADDNEDRDDDGDHVEDEDHHDEDEHGNRGEGSDDSGSDDGSGDSHDG